MSSADFSSPPVEGRQRFRFRSVASQSPEHVDDWQGAVTVTTRPDTLDCAHRHGIATIGA